MTSAIFKSTGAIIAYIVIAIGLLAIAGYNFWGWFGGSEKWRAEHPDNTGTGRVNAVTTTTITSENPNPDNSNERKAVQPPQSYIKCEGKNVFSWANNPKVKCTVEVLISATNCVSDEVKKAKAYLNSISPSSSSETNCASNKAQAFAFANSLMANLKNDYPTLHITMYISNPSYCP